MSAIIQIRRDTAAAWTSANPILFQGELGLELDTDKIKVGNGTSNWITLPYKPFVGDITSTSFTQSSPAINTAVIDLAAGSVFNFSASTAITLPSVTAGKSFKVVCALPPISWTGSVLWSGGVVPSPTPSKGSVFEFITNTDSTSWYGAMIMDNL